MLPFDFCEKCNQEHIGFHIKGEDISSEINPKYSSKKFADFFLFYTKKKFQKILIKKKKLQKRMRTV